MKIYDEFGNVINILPTYQQGGFILPQYKPSQVTLQAPSSEGLFRATESGTNNDWNRFVQGTQLNLQASRASQDLFTNAIDIRLKMQTQERVNKQLELQNKKFEYEIMKNNLDLINEGLAIGSEEFIEADRAAIDAQLNPAKDKLASTDFRDVDEVFKNRMEITRLKNTFTNGYANADRLKKGTTILNDTKNDKLLEFASKNKVLDTKVYKQYTNSKLEWAKALNEFNKTGDKSILDKAQEHRDNIEATQKFVNSDLFNQQIEIANQTQQAKAQEDLANAKVLTETLPSRIKLNEAKARLDLAKASSEISDEEFNQEQRKLQDADWELWKSENPNATSIERSNARNSIYSNSSTKVDAISSTNELLARRMEADGYSVEEIIDAQQRFSNADKTTTVNYTTDGNSQTYSQNSKTGERIYAGWVTDDAGVFKKGTYGGTELSAKQLQDAGAAVNVDGSIDIEQSELLDLIPGIASKGGPLTFNSTAIKKFFGDKAELIKDAIGISGGDSNIWKIKPTGTLPSSGASSSGSSYMGGQSTTPAPATSVGKNGMG